MTVSMAFRDRDGKERVIYGPELIDQDNEATKAELLRLKPLLASDDPAVHGPAEQAADRLFKRREELRGYAERWNRLVDDARLKRRFDLLREIDALGQGRQAGATGKEVT